MPRFFWALIALLPLVLSQCAPHSGKALPAPTAFKTPPTRIEGQILRSASDQPLSGARIATSPGSAVAVSDSSGRFALVSTAFQTGQAYRLQISFPGYARLELDLDALEIGRPNRLPPLYLDAAAAQSIPEPPDLSDIPEGPTVQPPSLDD